MNKLQEFWYCVAPQNDIPLYRGEALDGSVVAGLLTFLDYYRNNIQETFSESIQKALLHNPNFINDIRLLLGISDKRFYLDMTYLAHISTTANGERLVAEKREDLIKHSTAWFAGRLSRQGKLPGGATHEQTTQRPVRLLLYLTGTFGTEAGSRRMPPSPRRCAGETRAAVGAADYRCQRSHCGGYLHRQFHLWI